MSCTLLKTRARTLYPLCAGSGRLSNYYNLVSTFLSNQTKKMTNYLYLIPSAHNRGVFRAVLVREIQIFYFICWLWQCHLVSKSITFSGLGGYEGGLSLTYSTQKQKLTIFSFSLSTYLLTLFCKIIFSLTRPMYTSHLMSKVSFHNLRATYSSTAKVWWIYLDSFMHCGLDQWIPARGLELSIVWHNLLHGNFHDSSSEHVKD